MSVTSGNGIKSLIVNGVPVVVAEDGSFSAMVPLQVGLNTISVTASRSYTRPVTLLRRVRFVPPEPPAGLDKPSLVP